MRPLRLFCLPYAGGSAQIYAHWQSLLPPDIEIHPVELPGRGSRFHEAPEGDVERLADGLSRALAAELVATGGGPYALLGYSYGSILAFEIARRLEHLHGLPPDHLMVAAIRAPVWPGPLKPVARLDDEGLRARLAALGGTPPELLADEAFMELMMPVLRADFGIADSYLLRTGPIVSCPLTVFGGTEDHGVSKEALQAWEECGTGPFALHYLPGGHFFLRSAERQLLETICRSLGLAMAGSGEARRQDHS
ncbi:alpha/beta fold hydrolase [Streptomyces sp. OfavH-34-F]|uniref:thioesterase II family protein n=1 Tax=unclassified Streptomyces TaxID=2593676 RepID=UPI001EF338B3|nr:alpha/beta fold hydrolase [Streptomyces sp. OfavH-34-F]MCG7526457.1 alpha/beta fold hydrolase [Streptomyces sp. OfavH-34-F]